MKRRPFKSFLKIVRKFETCIYIEMRNLGYDIAVMAKMKFRKLMSLM